MLDLGALQEAMRTALIAAGEEFGDRAVPLLDQIESEGIAPLERLAIYRNNLRHSLTASLQATYPVVCRLVDERFFRYAAEMYIRQVRPAGPCLSEYGGSFPEFLSTFEPCRHLDYLRDVARFEWALNEISHAGGSCPVDSSRLTGMVSNVDHLRLLYVPGMRLLTLEWPADRIWEAHQTDEIAPIDLTPGTIHLQLWREDGRVRWGRIDRAAHAFRTGLVLNETLGAATTRALAIDPFFDLALDLRRLFRAGLISGFFVSTPSTQELSP